MTKLKHVTTLTKEMTKLKHVTRVTKEAWRRGYFSTVYPTKGADTTFAIPAYIYIYIYTHTHI